MTLRIINGEQIDLPPDAVMGSELIFPNQRNLGNYPYVFNWHRLAWTGIDRKGHRCRILCRGTMNSCLLEFLDGFRVVTSRNALRKVNRCYGY
jgi:hypothetical protein